MAFSFSRQDSSVVGLDIDGGYLAAAVVDGGSIGRVASMELAPGVVTDGEVIDPEALGQALKEMFARFKLPRRVRLGVANQQIVVRQLDLPVIPNAAERDAAVRFQAADAIAMPLEDAMLDYQVIGEREVDGAARQTLLVVAARDAMLARLVDAVKAAGLKAEGIDLSAFALVRVLTQPTGSTPSSDDPAFAICHLGGVTNLAIGVGSVCLFTRPLQTIYQPGDESLADSVAEEMRLSLDYYMAQDSRRVESIILSGPGSADETVHRALSARLGLEVDQADPLGSLGTHTVPSLDDPRRYTVAAGLALGAMAA